MTKYIPKIIKTEAEYQDTLARIEEIFEARPNTPEGDELELLTLLVEHYEETKFPIEAPSAVEAIRFRMEQMGLNQKDVAAYFGGQAKVSEVLSGRRALSLAMMRRLKEGLGLPADVLLGKANV